MAAGRHGRTCQHGRSVVIVGGGLVDFSEALANAPAAVQEDYWRRHAVANAMTILPPSPALLEQLAKLEARILAGDYPAETPKDSSPAVRVFSGLLVAIQRERLERPGQLWLIMRGLDTAGRGWLPIQRLYDLELSGRANVRRIVRQGIEAGLLYRNGQWLGYVSEAKLTAALGVNRLGKAITIPLSTLTEAHTAKQCRAIFHDAFHSGRGDGIGKPIGRKTVRAITGRCPNTQRSYERIQGMKSKPQVQIHSRDNDQTYHRLRYGEDGQPGRRVYRANGYILERLPNSYQGSFQTAAKSRRSLVEGRALDPLRKPGHVERRYFETVEQLDHYQKRGRASERPLIWRRWSHDDNCGLWASGNNGTV